MVTTEQCSTCGGPKEPTRPRSDTCRSCGREADKERKRLRALAEEPTLVDASLPFSPAVRKSLRVAAHVPQKALATTLQVQLHTLQRWEREPMLGKPLKIHARTRYVEMLERWAASLERDDLIELLRTAA